MPREACTVNLEAQVALESASGSTLSFPGWYAMSKL